MKDLYIGQIVGHSSPTWIVKGKLKIIKINDGKRSGLRIITAIDESGKEFTAVYGVFFSVDGC